MEITYRKEKDYFVPNLALLVCKNGNYQIGKYGYLRLEYLKKHKKGLYTELMLDGKLSEHLISIDKEVNKIIKDVIKKLAKQYNVNEKLKRSNQLEWVRLMNNFKYSAEEIVLNELIYV